MRTILWPLTAILLLCFGLVLVCFALLATLFSTIASVAATVIIHLLMVQQSPLLVKLMSFLGTEPSHTNHTKETQ